ncbi:MAG: SEC-C motif-containing protein [Flavobacterium sp.]|jgi:SEC-C motif-containing protein
MLICPCGNHLSFDECCHPIIDGTIKAATAEKLMRARYSAYSIGAVDFLLKSTHKSTRKLHNKEEVKRWSENNNWLQLEILDATEKTVTFKAHFEDFHKEHQIHYEKSHFVFENTSWYYIDGEFFD